MLIMWRSLRDSILWVLTGFLIALLECGIKAHDLIGDGMRRLLKRRVILDRAPRQRVLWPVNQAGEPGEWRPSDMR